MAAKNAIGFPVDSPFRNADQVPLPGDPMVGSQARDEEKERSEEKDGTESSESRELSRFSYGGVG